MSEETLDHRKERNVDSLENFVPPNLKNEEIQRVGCKTVELDDLKLLPAPPRPPEAGGSSNERFRNPKELHDYIGAKIFCPDYTASIKRSLLDAERIHQIVNGQAVQLLNQREGNEKQGPEMTKKQQKMYEGIKRSLWKRVERDIDGLIADMSSLTFLNLARNSMHFVLGRMYNSGIHVKQSEYEELQKWGLWAEKEKVSILFLPNHQSHIDYLSLSYVIHRMGLALPAIAAGDNLNMPIVGRALKKGGAFFIRRGNWASDPIYSAVVKEYIELLLTRGYNVEFFIEGTRSRVGKLLTPRFGILKIILEAVLGGRVKDVLVVPVGISYDKVIEGGTYVSELLGAEKQAESLAQVASSAKLLSLRLGRIDMRFGTPYKLSEFIKQEIALEKRPNFNPNYNAEHRSLLLQAFGFRVLAEIANLTVLMPSAIVGTILLTLRGQGIGRDELLRKFVWLRQEIVDKGGRVVDYGNIPVSLIVDKALYVMKDLIGTRQGQLLEPVYYAMKPFELALYRNNVINLFISEAILTTALYGTIKGIGTQHSQRSVPFKDLLNDVIFLSQLLKSEFIYKNQRVDVVTMDTIKSLQKQGVVSFEDGKLSLAAEEIRNGRENFDFYCFLFWPFLESYWIAAISCFTFAPDGKGGKAQEVDEQLHLERMQLFGKTLFYQGDVIYLESISKETLKNAVARLGEMGVLTIRKGVPQGASATSKPVRLVTISPDWIAPFALPNAKVDTCDPHGRLWDLVTRIGKYRREGKQRRDNMGVANRVLRGTRTCSEYHFGKKRVLERREEEQDEMERDEESEEQAIESLRRQDEIRPKL